MRETGPEEHYTVSH